MYYITKSDYRKVVNNITTFPYSYPPITEKIKQEMKDNDAYFLGFAVWCLYGLPEPETDKEREIYELLKDYVSKNLKIVGDEFDENLEVIKW